MANDNIECPVDFVSINENKARVTAALVFILTLIYLFASFWIIPAFLTIDFFVRGFNFASYSLLGLISDKLVVLFSIKQKPTDRAPKRFAAKIGFLFSAAILVFIALDLKNIALILAIVLATFALLESAFGFCAGCHVYSFYNKFLRKKTGVITGFFFLIFIINANLTTAQTNKTETSFTVENYYKVKWGFADEFIHLWKTNHYPLLKKAIEKGDIMTVTAEQPKLHSGEDTRWDFKVIIVFKNADKAFDAALTEPYKKLLYPDADKLKKDEQHRFELLIAHWDVMVDKIALD
jgi:hypothetical protein